MGRLFCCARCAHVVRSRALEVLSTCSRVPSALCLVRAFIAPSLCRCCSFGGPSSYLRCIVVVRSVDLHRTFVVSLLFVRCTFVAPSLYRLLFVRCTFVAPSLYRCCSFGGPSSHLRHAFLCVPYSHVGFYPVKTDPKCGSRQLRWILSTKRARNEPILLR